MENTFIIDATITCDHFSNQCWDTNDSCLVYLNNQGQFHVYSLLEGTSKILKLPFESKKITKIVLNRKSLDILVCFKSGKISFFKFEMPQNNESCSNLQMDYRWHASNVSDVCFLPDAPFFYSVGSEGVLVNWNTVDQERRIFLSHLGDSLISICMSNNAEFAAVLNSHSEIIIISTFSLKPVLILKGLDILNHEKYPTPFLIDIFNGKPSIVLATSSVGQLEWLDTTMRSCVNKLAVVQQNRPSAIRSHNLKKTISKPILAYITHLAIEKGNIATVDLRSHENFTINSLKFFTFQNDNASWKLCNLFENPHGVDQTIASVSLSTVKSNIYTVSTSSSKENPINIWKFSKGNWSIHHQVLDWKYHSVISADFAPSSSIFVVCTRSVISLWDASFGQMITTLENPSKLPSSYLGAKWIFFSESPTDSESLISKHVLAWSRNCIVVWNLASISSGMREV